MFQRKCCMLKCIWWQQEGEKKRCNGKLSQTFYAIAFTSPQFNLFTNQTVDDAINLILKAYSAFSCMRFAPEIRKFPNGKSNAIGKGIHKFKASQIIRHRFFDRILINRKTKVYDVSLPIRIGNSSLGYIAEKRDSSGNWKIHPKIRLHFSDISRYFVHLCCSLKSWAVWIGRRHVWQFDDSWNEYFVIHRIETENLDQGYVSTAAWISLISWRAIQVIEVVKTGGF